MLALLRGGIIEQDGIIIDAKSGTTGAGRKASEDFSFSEVDGDFRAYRVLRHQHTPEIERALGAGRTAAAQGDVHARTCCPPAGASWRRCTAGCAPARRARTRRRRSQRFVAGKPFLRAAKPEAVRLHPVVGTNRVLLGADADPERGVALALRRDRQPGQGGGRAGRPERQPDAGTRRDDRPLEAYPGAHLEHVRPRRASPSRSGFASAPSPRASSRPARAAATSR